jgi:hypothetical protein
MAFDIDLSIKLGNIMEKNIKIVIISIIIIVSIILFSMYIIENKDLFQSTECDFSYSIKANFSNETYFTLLVPLPEYSDGSISNCMISKLELKKGNTNWSINNTIYGNALKIEGSGDVEFLSSGTSNNYAYNFLSMQNNSNKNECWVYLDSSTNSTCEIEIKATCHIEKNSEQTITKISGEIKNGWNVIHGVHSHSMD